MRGPEVGEQEPRTRLRTSSPRALAAWCTPAAEPRPPPPGRAVVGSRSPWHPGSGKAGEAAPHSSVRAPRTPGASSRARTPGADHSRARGGEAGCLATRIHPTLNLRSRSWRSSEGGACRHSRRLGEVVRSKPNVELRRPPAPSCCL